MSSSSMIASSPHNSFVARVEKKSSSQVPDWLWQKGLYGPLDDFLQRQGKRIRAELIELSYRAAGGIGDAPTVLIEFIELLHGGSLIIDDIEDNSSSRRGSESLHHRVGLPIALNTGNWMYFLALEKLSLLTVNSAVHSRLSRHTMKTIRQCHEGQALDLAAQVDELAVQEIMATAEAITRLKTGGLTALAARLGAIAARATPGTCDRLASFGMRLGVGLQMQNDLAELRESQLPGGRCDDLRNRRVTWPWAWFAKRHSSFSLQRLQQKLADPTVCNSEVAQQLLDGVCNYGQQQVVNTLHSASLSVSGLDEEAVEAVDAIIARLMKNYV